MTLSLRCRIAAGAAGVIVGITTATQVSAHTTVFTELDQISIASSATLSGGLDPLGLNSAAWDSNLTDGSVSARLSAANLGLVRYPGGATADVYNWENNTANGAAATVNFGQYSRVVDSISSGQKMVTVNYGSDTPANAEAWANQSKTSGEGVALWEIGNEEYGSWETDNHANPHTPSSYAANARPYMRAIKAAIPGAPVCYDYGMDGSLAAGSGAPNWQNWNDTILSADASDINCADVHWYPFNGLPSESTQSIVATVNNIPRAASETRTALSTYDPSAYYIVGETNMSQTANPWNQEPVGALYAAANAMEWLSYGAQSVLWWDDHNYGSPSGDFGLLSSGTNGEPSADTPLPPYYGYALAAKLAVHGATVSTLDLGTSNLYGYSSKLPSGSYGVMLVNADPGSSRTVSTSTLGFTGSSENEYTYDNADPSIVSGSVSSGPVNVPPESIVVLTSGSGSGTSGEIHAVGSGKCLDLPQPTGVRAPAGTQVQIWDCNGGNNQQWTYTSSGQLSIYGGQDCLDAYNNETAAGTKVQIWPCNGGQNQRWNVNGNGTITGVQSGICLDVTGASIADGALLELWSCNGQSNQQWTGP